MKLSQIASISSGINERRNPQGNIYYLGGSDFISLHTLNPLLKPSIVETPKLNKHYLNQGDVLLLSKGHNGFQAHTYQGGKSPAVASSIFFVIKGLKPIILAEYLTWYINLSTTQKILVNFSRGSALPAINKKIVGDLEIKIPDIEIQKKIVALNHLKIKETEIITKLDKLKSASLEELLKNKIIK